MQHPYDLVIRGGRIVDGTGAEPVVGDVAIAGDRVAAVGSVAGAGKMEIDATGAIVTPGFVDIHTHYDGQVTWESDLVPSSAHGVTTVVMGNCGVGFAPCRPGGQDLLMRLMEGVEDIPHPVLLEGVPFTWESFPEYLTFLATRRYDMDVCGYVPHAALRVYVMGERGVDREPATPADVARMAALLGEAIDAGAMGFSTSLSIAHRSIDGASTPTYGVAEQELMALAMVLKERGKGALQVILDFDVPSREFGMLRRLAERSGRPLTFSLFEGVRHVGPLTDDWPEILDWVVDANREGVRIKAQVMGRAVGMLFGHELTLNPFYSTRTYLELAALPFAERVAQLRRPEVRARILAEPVDPDPRNFLGQMVRQFDRTFVLGDPPDYEPLPEASIAARAQRQGVSPEALAYDLMLESGGRGLLYYTFANYAAGSLDHCLQMMRHDGTVLGLADGGAHVGTISDAGMPSFMLAHWVRDRRRGERLPLPWVVKAMTHDTAEAVGLSDRGLLAPGYKADVNVIDLDRLRIHPPEVRHDLPSGGRRLMQRAEGYLATIVSGVVVHRNDRATGALPGRLVRGPQPDRLASPLTGS